MFKLNAMISCVFGLFWTQTFNLFIVSFEKYETREFDTINFDVFMRCMNF